MDGYRHVRLFEQKVDQAVLSLLDWRLPSEFFEFFLNLSIIPLFLGKSEFEIIDVLYRMLVFLTLRAVVIHA